jgi:arsenate reductase (thioredoxin)
MKIFFLSNQNSCRSQMAEAILRSFDKELEIYSAGIEPSDHVSPIAIEVMAEKGINLEPQEPRHYSKFKGCRVRLPDNCWRRDNRRIKNPTNQVQTKNAPGFHNPYRNPGIKRKSGKNAAEIRDEIYTEMDYFYHRIIKRQKEKSINLILFFPPHPV